MPRNPRSFAEMARETLADAQVRHALVGLLRQWVFGCLAGYEDVNDAERLPHDPTMRWIVGGKAAFGSEFAEPDGPVRDAVVAAPKLRLLISKTLKSRQGFQ